MLEEISLETGHRAMSITTTRQPLPGATAASRKFRPYFFRCRRPCTVINPR